MKSSNCRGAVGWGQVRCEEVPVCVQPMHTRLTPLYASMSTYWRTLFRIGLNRLRPLDCFRFNCRIAAYFCLISAVFCDILSPYRHHKINLFYWKFGMRFVTCIKQKISTVGFLFFNLVYTVINFNLAHKMICLKFKKISHHFRLFKSLR